MSHKYATINLSVSTIVLSIAGCDISTPPECTSAFAKDAPPSTCSCPDTSFNPGNPKWSDTSNPCCYRVSPQGLGKCTTVSTTTPAKDAGASQAPSTVALVHVVNLVTDPALPVSCGPFSVNWYYENLANATAIVPDGINVPIPHLTISDSANTVLKDAEEKWSALGTGANEAKSVAITSTNSYGVANSPGLDPGAASCFFGQANYSVQIAPIREVNVGESFTNIIVSDWVNPPTGDCTPPASGC